MRVAPPPSILTGIFIFSFISDREYPHPIHIWGKKEEEKIYANRVRVLVYAAVATL